MVLGGSETEWNYKAIQSLWISLQRLLSVEQKCNEIWWMVAILFSGCRFLLVSP